MGIHIFLPWMNDYILDPSKFTFPHPYIALEDGLLAVGGDLQPLRILDAYRCGIFPWFNEMDEILWWSPSPRFALKPEDIKVSKSMRSYFNQNKFKVTIDQCFTDVMQQCKTTSRADQDGTWIHTEMIDAYTELHRMGFAHSVEVWQGDELVGGLYGLAIGSIFFGESMFSKVSNASKYGFITLARILQEQGCDIIDCQIHSDHLESLGASHIDGEIFFNLIRSNVFKEDFMLLSNHLKTQ